MEKENKKESASTFFLGIISLVYHVFCFYRKIIRRVTQSNTFQLSCEIEDYEVGPSDELITAIIFLVLAVNVKLH